MSTEVPKVPIEARLKEVIGEVEKSPGHKQALDGLYSELGQQIILRRAAEGMQKFVKDFFEQIAKHPEMLDPDAPPPTTEEIISKGQQKKEIEK